MTVNEPVTQEEDSTAGTGNTENTVTEEQARQVAAERLAQARREAEEQIAELPPEDQEQIRAVQRGLIEDLPGVTVDPVVKWWGYEIYLNAKGAELAAQVAEKIGDLLSRIPKLAPFKPLIKAFCKLKAKWIKDVGGTYGCKLVSPWIAPGMLIPISLRPREDTSLWWTVYGRDADTNQYRWSEDERFTDHFSLSNPALAAYKGKLYCAHRGSGYAGDTSLWWTAYETTQADAGEPESGWTPDTQFPDHYSDSGPALATFGDYLYCVHRGSGSNQNLWMTRFDGTRWSTDTEIGGRTSHAPALAVLNNKLWCLYKGGGSSQDLYWKTFDGSRWSGESTVGSSKTNSNPALAVFQNKLYAVFRGGGSSTSLYYAHNSGSGWSGDTEFPRHASQEGPALAVFDNHLYCVHRGGGSEKSLWWTRFNGTTWIDDAKFPNHASTAGPAIITYRDVNGTEDQIICIHRGN